MKVYVFWSLRLVHSTRGSSCMWQYDYICIVSPAWFISYSVIAINLIRYFYDKSVEIDKWLHPTFHNGCNYLFMLGLRFYCDSQMGPWTNAAIRHSGRRKLYMQYPTQLSDGFSHRLSWCILFVCFCMAGIVPGYEDISSSICPTFTRITPTQTLVILPPTYGMAE